MNVYVDSSVVLRVVLGEADPLPQWRRIDRAVSSELIRLECLRTIDRARLRLSLPDRETAEKRAAILAVLSGFDLVPVDSQILLRAADPFPTRLGSLDAIHLASALRVHSQMKDMALATHDTDLATAARAVGLSVLGSTA